MKTLMNMMLALLLLTANVTIAQAINYPTYNNTTQVVYVTPHTLAPGYQAGDEVFQTSNLTPLVNSNGMAVEPYSAAPGRPRRAGYVGSGCRANGGGAHYDEDGNGICDNCEDPIDEREHVGSPDDPDKDKRIPIGTVLILLLFALMHVAFIAYTTSARKQK